MIVVRYGHHTQPPWRMSLDGRDASIIHTCAVAYARHSNDVARCSLRFGNDTLVGPDVCPATPMLRIDNSPPLVLIIEHSE